MSNSFPPFFDQHNFHWLNRFIKSVMPPRSFPFRGAAPSSRASGGGGVRPGIFHRESTRLRSNVADQVQRDLLPAGRMLSVFLILCELLAEVAVLIWSRGQSCDRPLRFWVHVLILLQTGTIVLSCLKIWQGRDTFGQHRNGLSATEIDMYTGAPSTRVHTSPTTLSDPITATSPSNFDPMSATGNSQIILDVGATAQHLNSVATTSNPNQMLRQNAQVNSNLPSLMNGNDSQPLLYTRTGSIQLPNSTLVHSNDNAQNEQPIYHPSSPVPSQASSPPPTPSSSDHPSDRGLIDVPHVARSHPVQTMSSSTNSHLVVSFEFVDRYMRIVNAWYLVWFILGSVWVSDGGTCSSTAPHLYRLIVALTIIYYALLFLPLACFCLIVCCLPLFILVYRIMLPYAERERRRARAADPVQVQNLDSIIYTPERFAEYTGNQNPDDASCVICLCEYEPNDVVRFLPCKHHFHKDCVDVWLRLDKACCLCKQDIDATQSTTPSVSLSTPTLTPSTVTSDANSATATTAPTAASGISSETNPGPSSSQIVTSSTGTTAPSSNSIISSNSSSDTSNPQIH